MATTEFTKRLIGKVCILLNKENKLATEFIVFAYSLILSIIRTLSNEGVKWDNYPGAMVNILLIFMNALIISYLSTASYSKISSDKKDSY